MSRSPKYTTAQLAAARQQEIENRRLERERQRIQQEQAARMQRIAALCAGLTGRLDQLARRVAALREAATLTGHDAQRDSLVIQIAQARVSADGAADEAQVAAASGRLEAAEAGLQLLGTQIRDVLARRRRDEALAAVRHDLAETDRRDLDADGHARVETLLARATAARTEAGEFDRIYPELARAVDDHLTRARGRRLELARMREQAGAAGDTLDRLLGEIGSAGAALDGTGAAELMLRELRAAAGSGDVPTASRLTAGARNASTDLERAFEQWLQEQDRTDQIIEAMREALPAAGLTVDPQSFTFVGSGGRFVARDAGRHPVQIAVVHSAEGSRIVYHADGHDFAVEHTAEGDIATCDLTEELLERFHGELARQAVDTDGVHWAGKRNGPRPDHRAAATAPVTRYRDTRR